MWETELLDTAFRKCLLKFFNTLQFTLPLRSFNFNRINLDFKCNFTYQFLESLEHLTGPSIGLKITNAGDSFL